MPATADFRLSITRALADQLAEAISKLTPTSLTPSAVSTLEDRSGVYQLFEDENLVYIGKADASLRDRLGQHHRKISGRLDVGAMSFICLYVDEDLHAVAPERLLINHFRLQGQVPWNYNGFGNKDPGKERDTTRVKADHFDMVHPANLDWICETVDLGTYTVAELARSLKAELPYVFRYDEDPILEAATVAVRGVTPTADELFQAMADALAAEHDGRWQITALPGYVIMYPTRRPYPSARRTYP